MVTVGTRIEPALAKKLVTLAEKLPATTRQANLSELLRLILIRAVSEAERRVAEGLLPVPLYVDGQEFDPARKG